MKTIFTIIMGLFFINPILSQTYTSHNLGGEWTEDSTWINNVPPYYIEGNNITIQISQNTNILSLENLTFDGNNVNLNIEGHLIVNGNVTMLKNNVTFNIFSEGSFTINGDLIFGNNVELTINGNLIIEGNVSGGGNISVGGEWGFEGDDHNFSGTLPIELLSFTAKPHNNSILIEWVTLSEINNDYFIIEKSTNLQNWESIIIISGAGTSNMPLKYNYLDTNPILGISYYRLTQYDFDGQFEIFNPISVKFGNNNEFLYVYDNILIMSNDFLNETLQIFNIKGHLLKTTQITNTMYWLDYKPGIYIIKINDLNLKFYGKSPK